MKEVIKIDITKTPMAIEDHLEYVYFHKIDKIYIEKGGVYPSSNLDVKEETWKVVEVQTMAGRKNYLVEVNSYDVFNDLIDISDSLISELQDYNFYRGHQFGYGLGILERDKKILEIKSLPWYKRLFNKF